MIAADSRPIALRLPLSFSVYATGASTTELALLQSRRLLSYSPGNVTHGDRPCGELSWADPPRYVARSAGQTPSMRTRFRAGADGRDSIHVGGGAVHFAAMSTKVAIVRPSRPSWRRAALAPLLDVAVCRALATRCGLMLHGAAFTASGLSVLALGDSGCGKSTLAAAAAAFGRVISDDLLLVGQVDAEAPTIAAWRRDVILREPSQELLCAPLRRRAVRHVVEEGARWVVRRSHHPERFADTLVPDIIWIVSVDRRRDRSAIARASQAAVLAALLQATSLVHLSHHYPQQRARLFDLLANLAACAPAFRLHLGRRLFVDPRGEMERLVDHSMQGAGSP